VPAWTGGYSLFFMNKTCGILRPSAIVPGSVLQRSVKCAVVLLLRLAIGWND